MANDCSHPHGKPENILRFSEDGTLIIDDAPLHKMLEHLDVKDRKVVAFSIIGAYRKGKSFFLDYCLRYLYAHVSFKIIKSCFFLKLSSFF
jgi:atlastin